MMGPIAPYLIEHHGEVVWDGRMTGYKTLGEYWVVHGKRFDHNPTPVEIKEAHEARNTMTRSKKLQELFYDTRTKIETLEGTMNRCKEREDLFADLVIDALIKGFDILQEKEGMFYLPPVHGLEPGCK